MFHISHLAGEVVLLVRVLAGGELAVEKGHSIVRLVLDDLHPLAPARLVLRGLRHGEQLRHLQNIRRSLVYSIDQSEVSCQYNDQSQLTWYSSTVIGSVTRYSFIIISEI